MAGSNDVVKPEVTINKARVVKYPEGYNANGVADSAGKIIDKVLALQMSTQSLIAEGQNIHDGLIEIQRLARGLLVYSREVADVA